MGLRETAELDLGAILEDGVVGFGWPITVTNPAEVSASLTGFSNDISQLVDPDTGQVVSGRLASVALRLSSLTTAGLGLPTGVSDAAVKPWIVAFDDINGAPYTFKVLSADPDRTIGMVVCLLEAYE